MLTVARGLQVLRAFGPNRGPLSNSQLARDTHLSKASVSRLTSTLIQLGYLRHVPGGRQFELAAGPLAVGHAFVASSELLQTALPLMQELANRLDVSVALGIRDGLDMLYVGYRVSVRTGTLRLGVGSVLPMDTTAIGNAYLWGLPAAEREDLVSRLRGAAGAEGARVERRIRLSFSQLRRSGTCAVLAGYQRGTYALALPVRVGRQHILMGFSCGKADVQPRLRAERERIAPELLAAARRLEHLLEDFEGPP